MIKKIFKIDPLKSFFELPILWIGIVILLSFALVISLLIIINTNLKLALDAEGFNSAVDIFKVPISILAIIITYTAVLAAAHRSIQTKEQILATQKQNTFSNYYKHLEEFEKFIKDTFSDGSVIFPNLRITHQQLFVNAKGGNYNVQVEELNYFGSIFLEVKNEFIAISKGDVNSTIESILKIFKQVDLLFSILGIKRNISGVQYVENNIRIVLPELTLRAAFHEIIDRAEVILKLLSFEPATDIPVSLEDVIFLDVSKVPNTPLDNCKNNRPFDLAINN